MHGDGLGSAIVFPDLVGPSHRCGVYTGPYVSGELCGTSKLAVVVMCSCWQGSRLSEERMTCLGGAVGARRKTIGAASQLAGIDRETCY